MSTVKALAWRRPERTELLRLACLTAVALVAVLPFFTGRLIGGVDARWYAFMLKGFTDQIGSDHVPMLIGQGPMAWNGGVHPFRSAPIYMLVGGLWKVLTGGTLGPFWIEHLTAITSAVAGTLGFYRAAVLLMPARRWTAAAFSGLYLCIPAWLSTVYKAEAYMSYMAFAAMPLVLYGNARSLRDADGSGYVALGAGLAFVWMCHPPIALLTTITTVLIQAAVLAQQGLRHWRHWALGAIVFAILAAYYFASMSELPTRPENGAASRQAVVWLAGLALFGAGLARAAFYARRWEWLAAAVLGLLLLAGAGKAWLIWGLFVMVFCAVAVVLRAVVRPDQMETRTPAILLGAALLAAAAAFLFLGKPYAQLNAGVMLRARINTALLPGFLAPLPMAMDGDAIFQPGWAVDGALALGVAGLFFGRRPASQVFGAVALILTVVFFHVPWISDFLGGFLPSAFAQIMSLPLPHRVLPVLSSFALMGALLWETELPVENRATVLLFRVGLVTACLWSGAELYPIIRIGYHLTATAAWSAQNLRPENIELDRYAYDLVHIPDYYSNGMTEPLTESRLVRRDGTVIVGPMELARATEASGSRHVRLMTRPIPGSTTWFEAVPAVEIGPGEHLLYHFAFDPHQDYSGFMIFSAEHAYREYHLPDSGQPQAFGIGPQHSSVLTFLNSGLATEHYHLTFAKEPKSTLKSDGDFFAELTISRLEPARLPIRLLSLDPYRAAVNAPVAGFLETFRVMLPGYRAFVDGREVTPLRSRQDLVQVEVPAGPHEVLLRYVGSRRLWGGAVLSLAGWTMLLIAWARGVRRPQTH